MKEKSIIDEQYYLNENNIFEKIEQSKQYQLDVVAGKVNANYINSNFTYFNYFSGGKVRQKDPGRVLFLCAFLPCLYIPVQKCVII